MSKVKVRRESVKEKFNKVPIVYTYESSDSVYMLVKDNCKEDLYKVVSLDNGYVQATKDYHSIEEFFNDHMLGSNRIIVDIDIVVKSK